MLKILLPPIPRDLPPLPGLPGWMSDLLFARGVRTPEAAQAFLHPSEAQLLSPGLLKDMDRAVALLHNARAKGSRAVIFGDYDVDGVCASAILKEALDRFGIECRNYIPDRHGEGYGLNLAAVEKLAREDQLLLTVDCGIVSTEEVRRAKELGMTVIVTDHHRHGDILPPADAVISPLLGDYPFPGLCGAGVAWKLALALLGRDAMPLMDLAALATVADMVPLTGENRALAALGLKLLGDTDRPGLQALLRRAGIQGAVSSEQAAFLIAPRINACGRMSTAKIALELLLTRDPARAEALTLQMETLNQQRKEREAQVLREALSQTEQMDLIDCRAIVVAGEGWDSGVVGLAAGRIAEKFAYPTVVLSIQGDSCVGSARSAGDVDIHQALSQCADLFDRFGGHRQAAGLTLRREKLPEFARRLSRAVAEQTGGLPILPSVACDGELTLAQVTEDTAEWLRRLEPCGIGNPAPRFVCLGVEPLSLRAVGAEGRHLKCTFRQGNELRDGIFFGGGDWSGRTEGRFQIVMSPSINEFRGKISAECRIMAMDWLPEGLKENREKEAAAFLRDPMGEKPALPVTEEALHKLMAGGQGTLLLCRCLNTAQRMRKLFPQAEFLLDSALDARAFHTILLSGSADAVCASFRRVVLCDGDWGEAEAYCAACPKAEVLALPRTRDALGLLDDAFVNQDVLRNCYRIIRAAPPRDAESLAQSCGLKYSQAIFALSVLAELGLIRFQRRPFQVSLLPMVKRGPEESVLFRRSQQAKEDRDGLHCV